jgi:hypothetical protein
VRRLLIVIILCGIFFLYPLQVYVIGDGVGIGIEGAVYRYQISSYGTSLIPITSDIMFIIKGIYSGKTALSIILWALGTILLTITTWFGLVYVDSSKPDFNRQVSLGLAGSCICYLFSCIDQYGILFHGPAGISCPAGIGIILVWLCFFWISPKDFF